MDKTTGSFLLDLKNAPAHSKIGLGVGLTSLGLGISNFVSNNKRTALDETRTNIDKKSLSALQKIHKALSVKSVENA